jgi:RHS repeat-associated protein
LLFALHTSDENWHTGYRTNMTDAHGETHWTYDLRGRLSGLQSGQSASLLNLEFTYDSVGNILTITDQLNSSQVQTFGYDALNRLTSASTNGVVSCIYGDQLGSVSAVADGNGNLISETLYHPWGTPRYSDGISPTDYGYTGQMQVGDIYFYNARWYDPQLGRFMQADTFVPTAQDTQAWDCIAYINNNPVIGTDPTGCRLIETGDPYENRP